MSGAGWWFQIWVWVKIKDLGDHRWLSLFYSSILTCINHILTCINHPILVANFGFRPHSHRRFDGPQISDFLGMSWMIMYLSGIESWWTTQNNWGAHPGHPSRRKCDALVHPFHDRWLQDLFPVLCMRPALGRAVEWQFFRTLCHADVGNLPQGSQGSHGSMMGTSIFYHLFRGVSWCFKNNFGWFVALLGPVKAC